MKMKSSNVLWNRETHCKVISCFDKKTLVLHVANAETHQRLAKSFIKMSQLNVVPPGSAEES